MSDITVKLREGTREQHRSIEKHIPVLRADLNQDLYLRILERFYGFYRPFEDQMGFVLEGRVPGLQFGDRRKISLIKKDLGYFGHSDEKIAGLPVCADLPLMNSKASALGALYVLEGSTLGGQIIGGHLEKKMGVTVDTGAAFYVSYGAETRAKWSEFQNVLRAELTTEAEHEEAVLAAQKTFSALEKWMSGS